eukprot:gb/GECH01001573.1/.p1 GENE.gb/GECH01001573.1/~~gb/GECH01001573.1/.p1  ORF type:complete len:422 (+),score=99.41 gb/GECH01001573.1/:1-1266(+)
MRLPWVLRKGRSIEDTVKRILDPRTARAKQTSLFSNTMRQKWNAALTTILPLGGVSEGNSVWVYGDGDDAFKEMWNSISNSKKRVWLETYTINPDNVGTRTLKLLADAAKRGCDVRLIYDGFGTSMSSDYFQDLTDSGAQVVKFNPLLPFLKRKHSPWTRNHRKILICDEDIGFCGGMNLSEDYAGKLYGNDHMRDSHLKVQGPAVRDLGEVFLDSLSEMQSASGVKPPEPPEDDSEGVFLQILGSNRRRRRRHIQRALRATIRHSQAKCYLTTPYFLPPFFLRRIIVNAAKRGVDVRILTAGKSDVPGWRLAAMHSYGKYLRNGVRIFEYQNRTLHAKTATIDGIYGSVGSYNLDRMSAFSNLEVNVTMVDPDTAEQLEDHFKTDISNSKEVTLKEWENRSYFVRVMGWALYVLMQIFGP